MRDAGLKSDPFRPMSPRAFRGWLALLYASAFGILLGVQFGWNWFSPAPSGDKVQAWVTLGGIFLGVFGVCHVIAVLLRQVAILGREIERLKEQGRI